MALGFFAYLAVLVILVSRSDNFDRDWFLDGRRKSPSAGTEIPPGVDPTVHAMEEEEPKGFT